MRDKERERDFHVPSRSHSSVQQITDKHMQVRKLSEASERKTWKGNSACSNQSDWKCQDNWITLDLLSNWTLIKHYTSKKTPSTNGFTEIFLSNI